VARPSLGPTASCDIKSCCFGTDWNKGKLILYPGKDLVEKPESMVMFDAARDFIFMLTQEGVQSKRKKWYHERAISIFKKIHGDDFLEKFPSLFKDAQPLTDLKG
jgi:hypothetical protein